MKKGDYLKSGKRPSGSIRTFLGWQIKKEKGGLQAKVTK
jgi:hypothetical protein